MAGADTEVGRSSDWVGQDSPLVVVDPSEEEGTGEGRGEVVAGVDVESALFGCAGRNMSPKSCFGCIHWAHSMIVVVACQPSPAWPGTLQSSRHFLLGMLQESPSHEAGQ